MFSFICNHYVELSRGVFSNRLIGGLVFLKERSQVQILQGGKVYTPCL